MSDVQIAVIDQQDTQIALAVPGVQGATGATGPTGPAGIPVVASGTEAAPAISFVSDPDTGINNNAANQLALVAGGQNVLLVDANGITAVDGDIELDDGGTFTTTLQTVTPTANRTISFPDATGTVALVAGSSGQLLYNASGANAGASTLTYDGSILTSSGRFINSYNATASSPAKAFTGTWFTGGTSTTTKPQVLIEPAGTTSTAWSTSGTGLGVNAASGFAGNLLDLQVNGSALGRVTSGGKFLSASTIAYAATGADTTGIGFRSSVGVLYSANVAVAEFTSAEIRLLTAGLFSWGSSGAGSASDLAITRDAADILAQRRTTNAQTSRVYGTYTDASNYVRAALSSTSTAVTLAAETAGTGADNIPLNLTAAGTGTIKVNSVAEVVVSSTVAGLPAAPVVGMLTRVTDATAPVVGVTVVGGGAAAALCWYNGANWSVIGV